jgi:16S rRNA processing protein RimM
VNEEEVLAVGRITRAHGVRGEVAVQSLTEVEHRFDPGSILRLEDGRRLTVRACRRHGHRLLVKFDELPDRTAVEALRGQVLLVGASDAPPLDQDDRFWVHEVVGLEAVTEEGRSLGWIREVQANPANDLWLTDTGFVIPALRDVVIHVDLAGKRATIRPIPGLLEGGE